MSISPSRNFFLTNAVSPCVSFVAQEGYRIGEYEFEKNESVPLITAACSRAKLFELFLECTASVGDPVDVVLLSDHEGDRVKWRRNGIDSIVMRSAVSGYEDLLLHDGNTGIAVASHDPYREVQLTFSKLIYRFGEKYDEFLRLLEENGLHFDERLKVITDVEHYHNSPAGSHEELLQFVSDIHAQRCEEE